MIKKKITQSKISGLFGTIPEENKTYLAIVEVNEAWYVPSNIKLRKWISEFIFTAEINSENFASFDVDNKISAIELNKNLNQTK